MDKKIGFNLEYLSSNKVFDYVFQNNNLFDFIIYLFLLLFLFIFIYYIGPKLLINLEKIKKKKNIQAKKKILNRMKISRDIETEIEEELKN